MPLVVLEGVDFVGKSTQSRLLAERFNGERQVFPDESTEVGRIIRGWLNREWKVEVRTDGSGFTRDQLSRRSHIDGLVFQCLQLLNRVEKLEKLEEAARDPKHFLVCDRYWASGIVYGGQDGLSTQWLLDVHSFLPKAQVSVLLELPESEIVSRMKARGRSIDRYEGQGIEALVQRAGRYRELWGPMDEIEPGCWVTVDASGSEKEVTDRIERAVRSALVQQTALAAPPSKL